MLGITYYDNQLIDINPTTGVGTLVGNLSSNLSAFGLAQTGGNLYAFDSTLDQVAQIDPSTGLTIKDINVGIGPVLGQGGLAFSSSGIGYLSTALDPSSYNPVNYLYSFNLATGTSTLLNPTTPSGATLAALAFVGDTLYGLGKLDDSLYTVNTTTGATSFVGYLGVGAGSPIESLAAGPGGVLFATLDDQLYTINPSSGAATAVDPNPSDYTGFNSISGLTYVATVPEPSTILLVGVGLAACLVAHRRRRNGSSAPR